MPCRVLITGIEGFTARHLAASLRADPGLRVLGTGRRDRTTSPVDGYQPCDITDRDAVRALVAWARPDVVYHLAGLRGDASEADMHAVNVGGFELLRTALRHSAAGRPVRLLVIGSAAEIGP
ncbi:MAG: NAD-dependent epimerase/dehydratase family protein, partial [Planctomycetota bacterium]